MAEITSIHLTSEAFDKICKNMDSGIFVSLPTGISNEVNTLKLENENPTKEELQKRINSLHERFQKFQTEQEKSGIEKIEFQTILDNQISALLNRDITDVKGVAEVIKQAEYNMLKLEREVAFIKAIENPTKPTKEQYQNHLKDIISRLDPQMKKNIQQIVQKQIENSK